QLISAPNELDGTAEVKSSDSFQGAGVTMNRCLRRWCDPCCGETAAEVSLLGGYRFYKYDSNLSVGEDLTVLPGTLTPLVPGTTFELQDSFRTRNEFNGGEVGLQAYSWRHWWWVDGMAKLAMGMQQRSVTIDGETTIDVPGGGTFTGAGGLLTAESTNIGNYDDANFVLIPEFRLGAGAKITPWLAVHVGYNLILWDDVARAGSSLPSDLGVDGRNLPPPQAGGGAAPEFPGIRGSQLVAHGLDAGAMCQW
ncbi:MAG TPA: BBP7 family outer membrane beta-barrel protein, partial [Lacipirellulaceae bacterium]